VIVPLAVLSAGFLVWAVLEVVLAVRECRDEAHLDAYELEDEEVGS
jgi:hypothetical protein